MANNDIEHSPFASSSGVRLPNTPHGLNEFQSFHNIAIISALNPTPAHFAFLAKMGVDSDAVHTANYRYALYQAVMRCSVRNPLDDNPKNIVVMDRATADWLAELFPGATVCAMAGLPAQLPIGKPGRTKQHKNKAARTNAWRANERMRLLEELACINDESFSDQPYRVGDKNDQKSCDEFLSSSGDFVTGKSNGFLFAHKYAKESFLDIGFSSADEFITQLRELHAIKTESKDDSGMITPACFDPDASDETSRGLDNVRHVRGIWLDNDGGDLTPDNFADLFPYLRMAIWNTYSHTAQNPRWRAFLPTTLAMSVEIHKLIMRQIERVLNDNGYWTRKQLRDGPNTKSQLLHGFDTSKFNASSLFYLPCQAQNPDDSFFDEYSGEGRGELDVERWLRECIRQMRPEQEPEPAAKTETFEAATEVCSQLERVHRAVLERRSWKPEQIIDEAKAEWRGALPGTGHAAFYKLALALRRAGLDEADIRATLREEAWHARSPKDRRAEINDIMKSLRRRGMVGGRLVK
jgi:hypothetical protein